MSDFKGTGGGWRLDEETMKIKGVVDTEYNTVIANVSTKMDYSRGKQTQFHNAILIVDAGNTMNSCGLLPSEILKQRDELENENKKMKEVFLEIIERVDDGLTSFQKTGNTYSSAKHFTKIKSNE